MGLSGGQNPGDPGRADGGDAGAVSCGKKALGWYKIRTFALLEMGKKAFLECLVVFKPMIFNG
jgi:hypothetical protein